MSKETGPRLFVERLVRHCSLPPEVFLCNPDAKSIQLAKQFAGSTIIGRLDGTTYYRLTGRNLAAFLRQRDSLLRGLNPLISRIAAFPEFVQDRFDRYLDRGATWLIKHAQGLVFQSKLSLKMHEVFLGFEPRQARSVVISNGVDIDEFSPTRAVGRLEGEPAVLISASMYRLHKRLQDAVRLVNLLRKEYPRIRLHVLGEPDILVKELLHETNCDRCTFHGRLSVNRLPAYYAAADVLLSVSIFDPCPNVVCEGLASGLPVITPQESGAAELVGVENLRWVVEEKLELMHRELHVAEAIPNAPLDEYANRLRYVISNLRQEKIKARTRAEAALDIKDIALQYSAFVEEVIKGH